MKCEVTESVYFGTLVPIQYDLGRTMDLDVLLGCSPSVEFSHGKRSLCKQRDRFCKSTPPHTKSKTKKSRLSLDNQEKILHLENC